MTIFDSSASKKQLPFFASIAWQMLNLGCRFVIMAVISDSMYALLAGTVGQWLKASRSTLRTELYVIGSVQIGPGVTAALTGLSNQ